MDNRDEKMLSREESLLGAVNGGDSQSWWVEEVLGYINSGDEKGAVDSFRESDANGRFTASEYLTVKNAFRSKFGCEILDSKYWTKHFDCEV